MPKAFIRPEEDDHPYQGVVHGIYNLQAGGAEAW